MKIAYLTTKYPSVSHTFIRRELREIERRGHSVLRLAIRRSDAILADPLDREEALKTTHCLSLPATHHFSCLLRVMLTRPVRFIKTLRTTIQMGRLSNRGIFRHLAYIVEACSIFYILSSQEIQHVHVHFGTNATAVARLIRQLGGPSYSFTVHGPDEFDAAIGFDLRGKISDAAFVVAITDYCAAQLRRWCEPISWSKIHVVGCTVGDEFFNDLKPIDPNAHTFVCVGRLAPQKGQLILLDAMEKLRTAGIDGQIVFVGDGELRSLLEERIRDLNLENCVRITGYVSEAEVRKYIAESRALILPSFAEGLPMVIMEAFAVGRPVISTYIAGIPELVRDGVNGWLVPAGNVEKLVEAISDSLATDAERLSEMASNGREETYNKHRTLTEVDRLEALFESYSGTKASMVSQVPVTR